MDGIARSTLADCADHGGEVRVGPVVVVGAGALGLTFAAALGASGVRVTLLVRSGSAAALRGAEVITVEGELERSVGISGSIGEEGAVVVTEDAAELGPTAAVLFATKGHALRAAVEAFASTPSGALDRAWFAGFQNGVVKDDVLAEAFGIERVVGATTVIGAQRTAPGAARVAGLGTTCFGELGAGPSARVEAAARTFAAAGLPSATAYDGRQLAWTKFGHAVGVFGVSALTGLPSGELFRRRPLILSYRALIEEVDAVARAEGVRLADFAGLPVATNLAGTPEEMADRLLSVAGGPPGPPSFSSMLQDLIAGRATEVDEIFGDLIRRGRRHGVPTPRVELVNDLVRGLDRGLNAGWADG